MLVIYFLTPWVDVIYGNTCSFSIVIDSPEHPLKSLPKIRQQILQNVCQKYKTSKLSSRISGSLRKIWQSCECQWAHNWWWLPETLRYSQHFHSSKTSKSNEDDIPIRDVRLHNFPFLTAFENPRVINLLVKNWLYRDLIIPLHNSSIAASWYRSRAFQHYD